MALGFGVRIEGGGEVERGVWKDVGLDVQGESCGDWDCWCEALKLMLGRGRTVVRVALSQKFGREF